MRLRLHAIALLMLLGPLPAAAEALAQSIPVAPGERLRIELARGDVDVYTHDAREIRLEASARGLGASGIGFVVTHEGDEIVLRSRAERWLDHLASGPSVRVRAWVPRHLGLAVETTGRVEARDGAVWLRPVDAPLR
jgi:hypothetical protein